jgi:HEAT repeat protein
MRPVRTVLLAAALALCACGAQRAPQAKKSAEPTAAASVDEPTAAASVDERRVGGPDAASTRPEPVEPPAAASPRPAGNERKTAEIAKTPDEAKLIEQLYKSGADVSVAKAVQADRKRFVPLMRLALRHEEPNVRSQASRVLVRVKESSPETTAAWIEALRAEAVPDVVANWAFDLRLYKAPEVAPVLLDLLRSQEDSSARQALAETLGALQYEPALGDIAKMLEAPETMERLSALSALKRLGLPGAADAVRKTAASDPNQMVKDKAQELLPLLEKK